MGPLLYLMLAYAAFWLISFAFIFSIFNRQRKLDEELTMLKQLLDNQSNE
ncbi:MAG: CcmD family protein [Aliifodinibius sp.]|nr:CcmD family protein [Fodinibius sp.]NIW43889.1 CcmD family protein [Gammaproteobacteria bacterium]NIY24281.1 CcmD family protein [Fodinibius sp.]